MATLTPFLCSPCDPSPFLRRHQDLIEESLRTRARHRADRASRRRAFREGREAQDARRRELPGEPIYHARTSELWRVGRQGSDRW